MAEKTQLSFLECLAASVQTLGSKNSRIITVVTVATLARGVQWLGRYHWGILLMLLFPLATDTSFLWIAQKLYIPLNYFIPAAQLADFIFKGVFIHLTVLAMRPSLESKDHDYARHHLAWFWSAALGTAIASYLNGSSFTILGLSLLFFYDKKPYPKDAIAAIAQTIKALVYFFPLFGIIVVADYGLSYIVIDANFWRIGLATIAWSIKIVISYALLGVLYTTLKHKYFKTLF